MGKPGAVVSVDPASGALNRYEGRPTRRTHTACVQPWEPGSPRFAEVLREVLETFRTNPPETCKARRAA